MPRSLTQLFKLAPLACACLLAAAGAHAPARAQEVTTPPPESFTAEVAGGVALYRQGDYKEAVKAFKKAASKRHDDPSAWHFLGLAYAKLGKRKDALKALEQAVGFSLDRLVPQQPRPEDEKLSPAEREARRLKLASDLRSASGVVADYLTLQPPGAAFWRAESESLRFHAEQMALPREQASVLTGEDVDRKAQVLGRPEPTYTEEARTRGVSGRITLRLVLASDGTVQHILVVEFLPEGLTDRAVEAARAIKFTPAIKDGRPVSQFVTIEYHFEVY